MVKTWRGSATRNHNRFAQVKQCEVLETCNTCFEGDAVLGGMAPKLFLPCCSNQSGVHMICVSFMAQKFRGQHHGTIIVPDKWSNEKYRRRLTLVWEWRDSGWYGATNYFLPCCNNQSKWLMQCVSFLAQTCRDSAPMHHDGSWQVEQWEV